MMILLLPLSIIFSLARILLFRDQNEEGLIYYDQSGEEITITHNYR